MPPVISTSAKQYSLTVPAHRFHQGGRDVYYFALTLETLDGTLPQRVDDAVVREANRQLTPSHARNIQLYLSEKDDWLLGAMMLGIAPNAVEFEPYPSESGETDNPNFGELRILSNRMNTMRIFDGQHRRRAVQEVLETLKGQKRHTDKLEALRKASMSMVLYAEDDIPTLRQMFTDASQTKRIEAHAVARFDRRDAFNLTANWLTENSKIFKGRVEMERSSVSASSPYVMAINQLVATLKNVEVGYGRRVSRDLNDALMLDLDNLYERCRVWADEFLPAARDEFNGLIDGSIDNSDIPHLRTQTFGFNVTFVRLLAGCYRHWVQDGRNWDELAEFIRNSSIDRGKNHGLLAAAGLLHPDGRALFARRQEVAAAINYIVNAAKSTA